MRRDWSWQCAGMMSCWLPLICLYMLKRMTSNVRSNGVANQEGAGKTLGEEVEQCNASLSRIAVTTKHMSKAGRNDMLTLLAIRWNQQKCPNLATALSQRYHKTSKALNIPIGDLETLKAPHQLGEQTVEEFVQEVKEWADGEIDHQGTPQALCKKIEALTTSINTRAQLLYRKNGSADFSTKKEVFHRVMGVRRLQEEKKILVKEMKQHWESLKAHARVLSQLSQHQSEDAMQRHLTEKATKGHTCLILPVGNERAAAAYKKTLPACAVISR
ncbi:uncharacterized protein LOC127359916 [Dicentrarchus labrax]|uniref:uncharacterized protein LOC127359916 n=1 Tax=Dicentrarchus labrax TaxID=13489 RepID=UPI0021F639E1|nr:uncharacterized protein LOC127359916 [Dicentrarchus labrax]